MTGFSADWLALRARMIGASTSDRLVPVMEVAGHLAWDSIMDHGVYPFPEGIADRFSEAALEDAIEQEDEATAIPLARRALAVFESYLPRLVAPVCPARWRVC